MSLLRPRRHIHQQPAVRDRKLDKPRLVRRFARNGRGIDLVCGDIHGCYDEVLQALREVGFDRTRDRLFSIGDTVDRGPGSRRAQRFLEQDWVHALRGNHEDMFLQIYEKGEPHEAVIEFATGMNGMDWWRDLTPEERAPFIERFRDLPIVIEIETARGLVGLVHAEVPQGMDWETFTSRIEAGDKKVTETALWGRRRLDHGDDSGVPGIDRLFVGHSIVDGPKRLGNVYYIDTGAVRGVLNDAPARGRLTVADVAARTVLLTRDPETGSLVDARVDEEPEAGPFGAYAR